MKIHLAPQYLIMKILLVFSLALFSSTGFSQDTTAVEVTDQDFEDLASSLCICVNNNADGLSRGMRKVIIKCGDDPAKLETALQKQVIKYPERSLKDIEALMSVTENMDQCTFEAKLDYFWIYAQKTQIEIDERVLEQYNELKECKLSYALTKIGLASESEEP